VKFNLNVLSFFLTMPVSFFFFCSPSVASLILTLFLFFLPSFFHALKFTVHNRHSDRPWARFSRKPAAGLTAVMNCWERLLPAVVQRGPRVGAQITKAVRTWQILHSAVTSLCIVLPLTTEFRKWWRIGSCRLGQV
jgi:hypothetical protein